MTSKSTEGEEMQTKEGGSTEREGVMGPLLVKEEAGWTRELEFETHSMKGGLLPLRTCLLCCRNVISHFCAPSTLRGNHRRWKNVKLL